jgi:cell division septation protein DedD
VTFEIDTSALGGRELVAFESLVRDGVEVARHADIGDALQTISIPSPSNPSISTELTDSSGSHRTKASDNLTLNDTVTYSGLEANKTYTVTGTLMDAATGKQITGKDGKPVETTQQLSAVKGNGTVKVPFTLNANELGGKRVVAFETIREGTGTAGRVIATHADLKSASQTVEFTPTETQDTNPPIVANASTTPPSNTTTPSVPVSQTHAASSPSTGTSPIQAASTSTPTVGTTTTGTPAATTSAALPHTYDSSRAPAAFLISGFVLVVMSVATRCHLDNLVRIRRRKPRHMRTRLKSLKAR